MGGDTKWRRQDGRAIYGGNEEDGGECEAGAKERKMKRTGFQGRGLWLLVLLGSLVVVGCKGGTPGFTPRQNRPPVIRPLEIRPANPEAGSAVRALVRYSDPDQDQGMLEYRWLGDGQGVQEGGRESVL